MLTSQNCFKRFGVPEIEKDMALFVVPDNLRFSNVIPPKIYCNKALIKPLSKAFENIIKRDLKHEVREWNGCFNIRKKRGNSDSISLHAWGVAIDINASENPYGKPPMMKAALVKCFTDAGFDWGGTWEKPDGMHFQLKSLP